MSSWLRLLLWLLNAVGLCRPPVQHVVEGGRSPDWPRVRAEHLRAEPECQFCGNDVLEELTVHHIQPVHVNRFRELDPTNALTLCRQWCHLRIGHLGFWGSWNPEVVEDCRRWREKRERRPKHPKIIAESIPVGYLRAGEKLMQELKDNPKVSEEQWAWFAATHKPPQSWYDEDWER